MHIFNHSVLLKLDIFANSDYTINISLNMRHCKSPFFFFAFERVSHDRPWNIVWPVFPLYGNHTILLVLACVLTMSPTSAAI